MKVSVEIPEGMYCEDCLFMGFDPQLDVGSEHCCIYLKYESMKQDRVGIIKHLDCPSLKQEAISLSSISTELALDAVATRMLSRCRH